MHKDLEITPLAVFSNCKQYTKLLRRGSLSVSKSKDQKSPAAKRGLPSSLAMYGTSDEKLPCLVGKTKPTSSYSTYNLAFPTLGSFVGDK